MRPLSQLPSGPSARRRKLNVPEPNPWKTGQFNAKNSATIQKSRNGYGFLHFVISVAVMMTNSISWSMFTGDFGYANPLGDDLPFSLSCVAACVSIAFSTRGSFVASAAIRDPRKNLAIACVVFLLNFLCCLMLSSGLMILLFLSIKK